MQITMIKKRLADGSDCRKCAEATSLLRTRGLWDRIDEVVWADEADADSPGMQLAARLDVDRAPFFVVHDENGEHVYTSVLVLIRDRLEPARRPAAVAAAPATVNTAAIDVDEIGGI